MDIKVGATSQAGAPGSRHPDAASRVLEAKVLAVRQPRKRAGTPPSRERRGKSADRDPAGGKVLVLLIPKGHEVPPDVESGAYRIFLRFARK